MRGAKKLGSMVLAMAAVTVLGTATAAASTPETSLGSGCGTSVVSGSTTLSLTIDGHVRTVIVHVPTGYRGSRPVPVVLNMHGSGSTAAQQVQFTGMDAASDADGFIVAYPQALIPEPAGPTGVGFDWNVPGVPLNGGVPVPPGSADDVSFLTRLPGALGQHYCVDRSRVFATGFSGGSRMASQLACDSSATFAAVAPVSGLRRPSPCPAVRPVPVMTFHGTADPIDPYAGNGQAYWTYSVPQAATYWASQDRCTRQPTVREGVGYTLTEYAGCAGRSTVELYSVTAEGHEWPGGPPLPPSLTAILGPQSNAVDANETMWEFFAGHPLR